MSLIETITAAQVRGTAIRPKANGFGHLAESLRLAGVTHIEVTVPSRTTILITPSGSVVQQGAAMTDGTADVPPYDRDAFITALRTEQLGKIAYPEWMEATWQAGVAWYVVDLEARTCTYRSPAGDTYVEDYPAVDLASATLNSSCDHPDRRPGHRYDQAMTREMEALYADLFEAAGLGRRIGEKIAATEGQTQARWQTMWTIDADDALTVPQIARRLGVSRQNEQRVVSDLVDGGLAELVPNPDHKTSPLARLTPKGRRALEGINAAAAASNDAIESELTPAKVAQLRKLLLAFTTAARTQHPET